MRAKENSSIFYAARQKFVPERREGIMLVIPSSPMESRSISIYSLQVNPPISCNFPIYPLFELGLTGFPPHLSGNAAGLVNPKCRNIIGSGVVVHVPSFFSELESLEKKGLNTIGRIFISDRAHLVFDLHQLVDGLEEAELGSGGIGTTKKGIGPAYSTKAARSGVRVHELFHWEEFEAKLRRLASGFKSRFGDLLKYDVEEEVARYKVRPPPLMVHFIRSLAVLTYPARSITTRSVRSSLMRSPL